MTPVIMGFKHKYPDARIHLAVNKNFVEVCRYIPDIDRIFTIPVQDIIEMVNKNKIVACYDYFKNLIKNINDRTYDVVINFTHSTSSAVLTSLINAQEIRGITIDKEGHTYKSHSWIKYIFNVIPCRNYNPFHLCDMHLMAAEVEGNRQGLYLCIDHDMVRWADSVLMDAGLEGNDLLIGLQIGASAEDKRWSIKNFARLADRLSDNLNATILLTGSRNEVAHGEEMERLSKARILNFIGKTDLHELAALIKRCNLFISNDSGPLHIATAVGTKTLNISLASVHFRETGPYGDGHFLIKAFIECSPCGFFTECKNPVCKEVINPDNVSELVRYILFESDNLQCIEDSPLWRDVQVYSSFFDEDGLMEYRPLIKRPLTRDILFTHLYRYTWLRILNKDNHPYNVSLDIEKIIQRLKGWYITDHEMLKKLTDHEEHALLKLKALTEIALSRLRDISKEIDREKPDIQWIKNIWEDIPLIDKELHTTGYTHPPLKPLILFLKYGKECIGEDDLSSMVKEAYSIYEELGDHITLMYELLKNIKKSF